MAPIKKIKTFVSKQMKKRKEKKQKAAQRKKEHALLTENPQELMRRTIAAQQRASDKSKAKPTPSCTRQTSHTRQNSHKKKINHNDSEIPVTQIKEILGKERSFKQIKQELAACTRAIRELQENLAGAEEAARTNSSFQNVVKITRATLEKQLALKRTLEEELQAHPASAIHVLKKLTPPKDEQSGEY